MGDKKRIPIDANLDNEWEKDMMQLPKEALIHFLKTAIIKTKQPLTL